MYSYDPDAKGGGLNYGVDTSGVDYDSTVDGNNNDNGAFSPDGVRGNAGGKGTGECFPFPCFCDINPL